MSCRDRESTRLREARRRLQRMQAVGSDLQVECARRAVANIQRNEAVRRLHMERMRMCAEMAREGAG